MTYSEHELEFTFANKILSTRKSADLRQGKSDPGLESTAYPDYFQNLVKLPCPNYVCGNIFMKIRSVVFYVKNGRDCQQTDRQTETDIRR